MLDLVEVGVVEGIGINMEGMRMGMGMLRVEGEMRMEEPNGMDFMIMKDRKLKKEGIICRMRGFWELWGYL